MMMATYRRKGLLRTDNFNGLNRMHKHHGRDHDSRKAGMSLRQELRAHILIHKLSQREHTENGANLLKPQSLPLVIMPLPTRLHFLILPKHFQQLGTKCSDIVPGFMGAFLIQTSTEILFNKMDVLKKFKRENVTLPWRC